MEKFVSTAYISISFTGTGTQGLLFPLSSGESAAQHSSHTTVLYLYSSTSGQISLFLSWMESNNPCERNTAINHHLLCHSGFHYGQIAFSLPTGNTSFTKSYSHVAVFCSIIKPDPCYCTVRYKTNKLHSSCSFL